VHPPETGGGQVVEVEADQEVDEGYPGHRLASSRSVTEDPQGSRESPLVVTREEAEHAVLDEREHEEVADGKDGQQDQQSGKERQQTDEDRPDLGRVSGGEVRQRGDEENQVEQSSDGRVDRRADHDVEHGARSGPWGGNSSK
jgi:hypothetical protein